jgi:hypothetical protein
LVTGGTATVLGLIDGDAKKKGKGKGKGKKKDPTKEYCKKAAAACANGKCGMGQPCCHETECDDCTNLWCVGGGGGRPGVCACFSDIGSIVPIDDTDIMHNGRCGAFPTCLSKGAKFQLGDGQPRCCSLTSHVEDGPDGPINVCDAGTQLCLADVDCVSGSCRGFRCPESQVGCPGSTLP